MTRPLAALLCLGLATPLCAQEAGGPPPASLTVDAARAQVEESAMLIDTNGDALIDRSEIDAASVAYFASIDVDGSGTLTRGEFLGWEFGLADMAAFRGRSQGYEAAMGMVFDFFDRDGDRLVAREELEVAIARAHLYADTNDDQALTFDEFRSNFIINVALRNAMVPQGAMSGGRP
jgi:Ca2+-binding EF-hand superfamily protein